MTREEAKKILKQIVNTSNELTHPVVLNTEIEAIKVAIEALSDVPDIYVGDMISRQDAIDAICTWDKFGVDERGRVVRWYEGLEPYVHLRDVVFAIEKLPSAEPKQKTGKWKKYEGRFNYNWECSECECSAWEKTDYCAYCGARMVGDGK